MRNRQEKCPGCGLVNFRDAAECRRCALMLRARAHAKPSYRVSARAGTLRRMLRGMLFVFVVLVMAGTGLRHVRLTDDAEVDSPAGAAETTDGDAKPGRRGGPPSLSDRRGGDAARRWPESSDDMSAGEVLRMGAERKEEFNRVIEDHERGVYGDREMRRARDSRRGLSGPSPGQRQQPVFLEARPPRDITNEP